MTSPHRAARARAMRKQVFGCMLVGLAGITAILSRIIGFELDVFYVAIGIIGAGLLIHGTFQKRGAV